MIKQNQNMLFTRIKGASVARVDKFLTKWSSPSPLSALFVVLGRSNIYMVYLSVGW